MIDRMIDRCQRICGSAEGACFVNNRSQLKCIADMVINKTAGITMTLDFLMNEGDPQALREGIRDTIRVASELTNWIKYMQLVQDLRQMSSLVLDSDQREKRNEIRYPVPSRFYGIKVSAESEGGQRSEGQLENFSSSGLRFTSNIPMAPGTSMRLIVSNATSKVSLSAIARYCGDGGRPKHVIGALLLPEGDGMVNFFNDAYRLLMEDMINL